MKTNIAEFIGGGYKDMLGDNKEYYLNRCSGSTKVDTKYTHYGYEEIHKVGNATVKLSYMQYANGEDDYDDELVGIKVKKYPESFISLEEESIHE